MDCERCHPVVLRKFRLVAARFKTRCAVRPEEDLFRFLSGNEPCRRESEENGKETCVLHECPKRNPGRDFINLVVRALRRPYQRPVWACLHGRTTADGSPVSTESGSASFGHRAGPKMKSAR